MRARSKITATASARIRRKQEGSGYMDRWGGRDRHKAFKKHFYEEGSRLRKRKLRGTSGEERYERSKPELSQGPKVNRSFTRLRWQDSEGNLNLQGKNNEKAEEEG